jgi:Calx-beta domain
VFTIELSRPVDDLLVVIYSTVDGIARSGVDYEPLQGILTLPAGVTSQEVRTKVIDDADVEGDKDFQLFLATNPDLTRVAEQWTRVTIRDDD